MVTALTHPLSATKLRNAIKREADCIDDLEIAVKNTRVNGQLRGCSGFITNTATGSVAYVSVECDPGIDRFRSHGDRDPRALYRTAKSTSDFRGGTNCYARNLNDLPGEVLELIA